MDRSLNEVRRSGEGAEASERQPSPEDDLTRVLEEKRERRRRRKERRNKKKKGGRNGDRQGMLTFF